VKNCKRSKVVLSGLLLGLLLFGLLSPLSWGQGLDIELIDYSASKSSIRAGDMFTLTLTIRNNSDKSLNNLYLMIDSDAFFVRNQGSQIPINPSVLATGQEAAITLDMAYNGGSGQIPLIFKYYQDGEENEQQVSHVIGMIIKAEEEEPQTTQIENETTANKAPVIRLVDKGTQQAAAGAELEVQLKVKNLSSYSAKQVLMSMSFEDVSAPFSFLQEQAFYLSTISNGSTRTVNLKLKVDNTAKAGTYPLKIDYQYSNSDGESFTSSETLYIRVTGGKTSPRLVFTPQGGQGLKTGEDYQLVILVSNRGGLKAKDINIDLTGLNNEGIVLSSGGSRQYINDLAAGSEVNIFYQIQPGSKVKDGSYPLTLKVSYKDESGEEFSDTQDVFVSVGKGGSLNGAPKIIINRYVSDPVIVRAGDSFSLSVSFMNTHAGKTVQNIKVVLNVSESSSDTGSVFTPVYASNTFYIDRIEPQQTVTRSLELYTIPDATAKTYSIDAALEYEDEEGTEYKTSELIGIPVKQTNRLDIGEVQIFGEGMVGQPVPVSCEFYNTGRVTLRNLMVKIQGDFEAEGGAAFIGNMEPGSTEYYDATIIPREPGTLAGILVFTFEDQSGEKQSIEKDFTLQVLDAGMMEPFPGEIPGDLENGRVFKVWYAIIPAIIAAGAVFWLIRRRKLKKDEEIILDE